MPAESAELTLWTECSLALREDDMVPTVESRQTIKLQRSLITRMATSLVGWRYPRNPTTLISLAAMDRCHRCHRCNGSLQWIAAVAAIAAMDCSKVTATESMVAMDSCFD